MSVRARVCITLRMCVLGHCQRYKNFVITSISTNLQQFKKNERGVLNLRHKKRTNYILFNTLQKQLIIMVLTNSLFSYTPYFIGCVCYTFSFVTIEYHWLNCVLITRQK